MDLKEKILERYEWHTSEKRKQPMVMFGREDVREAMDELSKIVAIAFNEWTSNYQWQYLSWGSGKPSGWHKGNDYNTAPITTNALYDLFTQSKEYKELMD